MGLKLIIHILAKHFNEIVLMMVYCKTNLHAKQHAYLKYGLISFGTSQIMRLYTIHYFYMNLILIHIIQLFIKVKHLQNQLSRMSYTLKRQNHQNFTQNYAKSQQHILQKFTVSGKKKLLETIKNNLMYQSLLCLVGEQDFFFIILAFTNCLPILVFIAVHRI